MAKLKPLPLQSTLRELLEYDANTGIFKWRVSLSPRVKIGDLAGCVDRDGYRKINIGGIRYLAHRLAFVWMTGECPEQVDHEDRNTENNAWNNLRAATGSQNQGNKGRYRNNNSGVKGVYWIGRRGKWRANIGFNGRIKHLGYFTDINEAAAAYERAAIDQWGEFANIEG